MSNQTKPHKRFAFWTTHICPIGHSHRGAHATYCDVVHEGRVAAFLAVTFLVLAGVAAVLALRERTAASELRARGLSAPASVVKVFTSPTRAGETRADVEFTDREGKAHSATIPITREIEVGSRVEVIYDPADPSRVLLSEPSINLSGARRWLVVVVFGMVLAIALGIYAWVPSVRDFFSTRRS